MIKKHIERKEAWMRIVVCVVSGIILSAWRYLIYVFFLLNFINTIFTGRRLKEIAAMSEIWNSQVYIFLRYMNFVSNTRPFPFEKLEKSLSKFK